MNLKLKCSSLKLRIASRSENSKNTSKNRMCWLKFLWPVVVGIDNVRNQWSYKVPNGWLEKMEKSRI